MTCKDCYHYDACNAWINHGETLYSDYTYSTEDCPFYKGKSRIVELPYKFVQVPCKVGDKVYKLTRNKVKECEVVFVGISADEKCSYFNFVENYADGTFYKSYSMVFGVLGKTVFLTREEAKEALRKEREK